MKKLLSILLCFIMLFALSACSKEAEKTDTNAQKVENLLSEGKFADAYKKADSDELKDLVMAENLLSFFCYDLNVNVDSKVELIAGYFGQVKASEEDGYTPSNEALAIDNYAKLAEYIAMLRGDDILEDNYYGVVKILVEEEVEGYGFVSLSKDNLTCTPITTWFTLDREEDDTILEDLYKYIARKLIENGTQLSNKAVERINKKYLSDSPKEIEFEIKS